MYNKLVMFNYVEKKKGNTVMTIRHLRIFQIVCKENSISKAAKELFMSQPAISHVIRELEDELTYPLFDRIHKRIYLTEAGKQFLEKVNHVLLLFDDLEASSPYLDKYVPLSIGSSITFANFCLPTIMRDFEALYPHIKTHIQVCSAKSVTNLLLQNQADIGLIEGVIEEEALYKIPFSSYKLAAYSAPFHPLAKKASISLQNLVKEKLLLREKGSAIRETFDSILTVFSLTASPSWVSVNSSALIEAARFGLGITIMPDILVKNQLKKGELIPLNVKELNLSNNSYIVYHKNKHITSSMKCFIDFITEHPIDFNIF